MPRRLKHYHLVEETLGVEHERERLATYGRYEFVVEARRALTQRRPLYQAAGCRVRGSNVHGIRITRPDGEMLIARVTGCWCENWCEEKGP
jgi:hypothetical protein